MSEKLPDLEDIHTIIFDFDGVFTDNKVWVNQEGYEWVCCNRGDGLALDILRSACRRGLLSAEMFVLSTETNPLVRKRTEKLKLDCYQGVSEKLEFVRTHIAARNPVPVDPLRGVVFLGNDLNDLPLLRHVGCAVVPSDAHPLVRACADVVLPERGGELFVRGFVERMLSFDQLNEDEICEFISDR